MTKVRAVILGISALAAVFIVWPTAGILTGSNNTARARAFVRHWSERFRAVNTLDAAKVLEQSECIYLRALPSGEWFIATCEHSCCSGAGFDATVICDSTGAIYSDVTHRFCGFEGLSSELRQISARTLPEFYSRLSQLKLERQ